MGFLKNFGRKTDMSETEYMDTKIENISIGDLSKDTKPRSETGRSLTSQDRQSAKIAEINALKNDLARTTDALRESIRLNKNSVEEIEKLNDFMKTAEVSALSLERLQPENAELKSKMETVQSELSKKTLWASELESKSMAYKARFEETHAALEKSNAKISALEEKLLENNKARAAQEDKLDRIKAERRDLLVMINDLKSENATAQTRLQSLRDAEKALARQNAELEKQADVVGAQLEDERREKERACSELKTLRLDYSELKADYMETLSKLDKALHEVESSQATMTEYRERNRDKIFALNATIDGLKAQQKINEDMSRYDQIEKEKLRAEVDAEKKRADELKKQLNRKENEMDESRKALGRAKTNYDELNQKFLTLLSEMEELRRDHKQKSKKLEEYSSISGVAVGQSYYDDPKREAGLKPTSDGATPKLKLVKDTKSK